MAQKTRISISKEWREWVSRHIQYVTLATAPLECRSGARLLCSSQQSSLIAVTFVHRKRGQVEITMCSETIAQIFFLSRVLN